MGGLEGLGGMGRCQMVTGIARSEGKECWANIKEHSITAFDNRSYF